MASNLRRTDDLHRIKAREVWLQDVSGTYAPDGSILYVRGDGLVQTHSGVYVPAPGDLEVPGILYATHVVAVDVSATTVNAVYVNAVDVSATEIMTNHITLTGPCASISGVPGEPLYSRVWMKQRPAFNTSAQEASNLMIESFAATYSRNMKSVACDSLGNTYAVYTTAGTILGQTSSGLIDVALAKFASDGTLLWVVQPLGINTATDDMFPTITIGPANEVFIALTKAIDGNNEWNRVHRINPVDGSIVWSSDPQNHSHSGITATNSNVWFVSTVGLAYNGPQVYSIDSGTGSTTLVVNINRQVFDVDIAKSSSRIYLLQQEWPTVANLHLDYIDIVTETLTVGTTDALFNPASWGSQFLTGLAITVGPDQNPVFIYFTTSNAPGTTYSGSGVDIVVVKVDGTTLIPLWIRQFSTGWADPTVLSAIASSIGSSLTVDSEGRILVLYTTNVGTDIDIRIKTFDSNGIKLSTFAPPFANTLLPDYVPSITTVPGSRDFVITYHTDGRVSGGVDSGGGDLVVARYTPTETPIVLQPDGGFVGIGTCTPVKKLDVNGQARVATLLTSGGDPTASGGYKYIDEAGSYISWNPAFGGGQTSFNNQRSLGEGGFEFTIHNQTDPAVNYIKPMVIRHTTAGPLSGANVRVGINTVTPQTTLDVSGTIRSSTGLILSDPAGGVVADVRVLDKDGYQGELQQTPGVTQLRQVNTSTDAIQTPYLSLVQSDATMYVNDIPGNQIVTIPNVGDIGIGRSLDVSGVVAAHDLNGVFGLFSSGTATILDVSSSVGPIPVPGLTPSGRVLATFQGDPLNATKLWATLGTDEFTLHVEQNPSDGHVDIAWLVLKL